MDVNVEQAWKQFVDASDSIAYLIESIPQISDYLSVDDVEALRRFLISTAIMLIDLGTFESGDVPNAANRAVDDLRSQLFVEDD